MDGTQTNDRDTQVPAHWDSKCAVTGSGCLVAIRASRIKPWRSSTNSERLDPRNGLPTMATLDALFDAGLITFTVTGRVMVSARIAAAEVDRFQLYGLSLRRALEPQEQAYLAHHRERMAGVKVGAEVVAQSPSQRRRGFEVIVMAPRLCARSVNLAKRSLLVVDAEPTDVQFHRALLSARRTTYNPWLST